ncbi:MAG: hypothetical protein H0X37_02095 [Herpetosiphonaceae bacterium]|nr:hypothetical protein [Herpetosiphonaceae bacterium]
MRRSRDWLLSILLSGITLLLCGMLIGAGWRAWRSNTQQPVLVAEQATPSATTTRATEPAATPLPTALPTVVPPTTAPSQTPTAVSTTAPPSDNTPATPVTTTTPTTVVANLPLPELPSGPLPNFAAALSQPFAGALAQHTDDSLYRIGALLNPADHTITGRETVRMTNTTGTTLNEIYFRLWVNAPFYKEGDIAVADVKVDGQPVKTELSMDNTTLKLVLAQPLAPKQSREIAMDFTTTVPTTGGGYGIFNVTEGVWALYNWQPELAVYEHGGWLLDPVTEQGDPTNTDAANYQVRFAAPPSFKLATSGSEVAAQTVGGETIHELASPLTRNMVIVASDRFAKTSTTAGAIKVNSWYLPGHDAAGKAALASAARAVQLYDQRFGHYAYPELDVTEVKLGGGAAGMESTGLVMIGSGFYAPDATDPLTGLGELVPAAKSLSELDFTVAHEVGHQWWYGVVGSDAFKRPWQDESLTNWSSAFYVDETAGAATGAAARDVFIRAPYDEVLADHDERLDQPVDHFNETEYGAIVYGKGPLMYDVLRKQIGDPAFFDFLRRYYVEHAFARVDGDGWHATLAEVSNQQTADAFYQKWVEGDKISASDLPPGGPLESLLNSMGTGGLPTETETPK